MLVGREKKKIILLICKSYRAILPCSLCILITSTIRTFLRITGRLFVACTTIRAGNCDHVQLGRIYWLIIHQFLFAWENFITYRAWIIFIFSLIFKNIYGHAQWVRRSSLTEAGRKNRFSFYMIVVKIMDDGIHWVAAVYHVGSVFNITVNFSRIAGSTFPYVGLFPDADEYSDDKSKADCQKGNWKNHKKGTIMQKQIQTKCESKDKSSHRSKYNSNNH